MSPRDPGHDEQTPLLSLSTKKTQVTPLPWGQFSIVMIMQLAEPVTSSVIYPFAPDLIRRLGIPEPSVGHYVGLLQSLFFFTQSLTVLHWSRLSDIIGRKPVILCGLCGLALSMYCFGLSTTFWGLVISRCLNGALNGNIGVMKSVIAELTDATNVAKAVSVWPLAWSLGSMLGPIIGGFLSRPAERWPDQFGDNKFMKEYPYFLACAVPATFSLATFFIALFFFRETIHSPLSVLRLFGIRNDDATAVMENVACSTDPSAGEVALSKSKDSKALPFKKLLTRRVVLAGAAYAFLSLSDICYVTIQPTFLSTPISYGGLGWTPSQIGKLLSIRAVANGLFQVLLFARLVHRFGPKTVFLIGVVSFFPIFAIFPFLNQSARETGSETWVTWVLLSLQVLASLCGSMSYGSVIMYINSSSPNTKSIGATNGVCQMLVSVMRAIGPSLANSLFSISLRGNYLGGALVYAILLCTNLIAMWIGVLLPHELWKIEEED